MNERFIKVLKFLISSRVVRNQQDFCDIMGLATSYVARLKSGDRPISENIVSQISGEFPQINGTWLLTGEGEMLKREESSIELARKEAEPLYYVPLLPISAQGGSLNDYVTSVRKSECELIPSPIKGADWAIQVDGDSMYPKHPNGSYVLIKKIYEKAFIQWGESFVLDTCNGVVVKRLFPSEHEDCVKCVSINPDFPPFEVEGDSIFGVYKVVMTLTK